MGERFLHFQLNRNISRQRSRPAPENLNETLIITWSQKRVCQIFAVYIFLEAKMTQHKGWYTISELARHISMSRKTVWAWIRKGKLQSQRYGSQHRVTETNWQRYLADCNKQGEQHEKDIESRFSR